MADSESERMLGEIERKARERLDGGEDMGHNRLLGHAVELLQDVQSLKFHDFLSSCALPKTELVERLETLRENVVSGVYDN